MFRVSLSRLLEDQVIEEKELRYLDDGDLINITRNTPGVPEQTMKNLDTRHLYKKTDTINLAQFEEPSLIVEMDKKYLTEAEESIANKLDLNPEEVIIDMPEELSFKKMNVLVESHEGLKPLTEVSTIIDSLKQAQYNYADLALFMSPEHKEIAIEKGIKLADYLTLPN
jgi:HD superfamily phosphohydrolase